MDESIDDYFKLKERHSYKRMIAAFILPAIALDLLASLFYMYSKEGAMSPDGTSCFAIKYSSKQWTAWSTSDVQIDVAFKMVNVGQEMAYWFLWGALFFGAQSFFFLYILIKSTLLHDMDFLSQEQIACCCTAVAFVIWYIVGLFIRYDKPGNACSEIYMLKAANLIDWYYGITLSLLALITLACLCLCLLKVFRG